MNTTPLQRIRTDRQCRLIFGAGLFFLLTTLVATLLFAMSAWDTAYRNRLELLTQLSKTVAENVRRVFDIGDQTIRIIRREYEQWHYTGTLLQRGSEQDQMGQLWHQIAIADQTGKMLATSLTTSTPAMRAINLADRPHFLWHAGNAADVPRVSPVLVGRASGKPSMQLTRRLRDANGEFAGIIVASFSPQYFLDYFTRLSNVGEKAIGITLIGEDGVVRARTNKAVADFGQELTAGSFFTTGKHVSAGVGEGYSQIDQTQKLFAFEPVAEYGLTVYLSSAVSDVRKEWWNHIQSFLVLGLLLLMITVASTLLLLKLRLSEIRSNVQLRAREDALAKANEFQARMISSVSHELRTPLTSILGYAALIAEFKGDQDIRDYGRTICASGEHLRLVINGILDLSRKEKGKLEAHMAPLNIRQLTSQSVELFRINARQKGLDLVLEIADGVPDQMVSDFTKFAQILENLLSNAIKFTSKGMVSVRVGVANDGQDLTIAVADTGLGIPAAAMQMLFEPFSNVKSEAHEKQQGAGLGLNIVKEFAILLGGRVEVSSVLSAGSTFTVTLPLTGKT